MDPLPTPRGWWLRGLRWFRRWLDAAAGLALVLAAAVALLVRPFHYAAWVAAAAIGVCLVMRLFTHGAGYGRDAEPYAGPLGGVTGLVLPYSATRRRAAGVSTVAFGVAGAALALWSFRVPDGPPDPAPALLLAGVAVAVGSVGSYVRGRRDPPGGVVLTPDAVTLVDGRRITSVGWEGVGGVKPGVWFSRWGPSDDYLETLPPRGRGPRLFIPVDPLGIDPTLAYWTLRHYAHHPAHRAELADERAVRRVRDRDLG